MGGVESSFADGLLRCQLPFQTRGVVPCEMPCTSQKLGVTFPQQGDEHRGHMRPDEVPEEAPPKVLRVHVSHPVAEFFQMRPYRAPRPAMKQIEQVGLVEEHVVAP